MLFPLISCLIQMVAGSHLLRHLISTVAAGMLTFHISKYSPEVTTATSQYPIVLMSRARLPLPELTGKALLIGHVWGLLSVKMGKKVGL